MRNCNCMKMSKVKVLRDLVNQRQSAAAEEILELFDRSRAEDRDCYSAQRQHKLLDTSLYSLRAEVQRGIVIKQILSEQQWRPSVDQEDPEPLHIKVEQEEVWSSLEGEQLQGPVPVKSEDDEEKPQSSQLHQRQTEEQIKARADGASGPDRRLRVLVRQRLTAAVEDIFGLFVTTLAEYEEEIEGLQKLLEEARKLEVRVNTADDPQLLAMKEEESRKQEWSPSVDQEDPEPPHIKEEQEEVWSSVETVFETVTAVSVKSEDEEEKPQSSQLHQRQTDQWMETGTVGGSGPERIFGPAPDLQPESYEKDSSDHETEHSDDYSQEMSQPQSGLVIINYNEDTVNCVGSNPVEDLCGGTPVNGIQNMTVDTGEKPFSCSICGKGFSEDSGLKRHLTFHTEATPFSCVLCEKHCTDKADLKRHMRLHPGEKPFSCPICGRIFSKTTNLRRHQITHTGERPFSCPACTKKFTHKGALVVHMRIHTGEKPFSCPVCTKTFSHRSAVGIHMRLHTGEKPFNCPFCTKAFTHRSALIVHMRIHTGELPFGCSVCGRRFPETGNLRRHMRTHTGKKQSKCSVSSDSGEKPQV